jgi:hypothetical protein
MRPWHLTEPDDSVITAGRGEPESEDRASALRARDGSFVLVYLTFGSPVSVDLDRLTGAQVRASWYDPRTGDLTRAETFPRVGIHGFVAPSSGRGHDWVLVLDDADATLSTDLPQARP